MAGLLAGVLLLATGSAARALPIVYYTATHLGGGVFQYDLLVDNDGGGEGLSGLNVLKGGSVFGLDGSSTIGAPAGWSSFAPLPPLIDDLDYFSLSPGSDIPIGGSLGGFSFQAHVLPSSLTGDDFAVEGIGADSASQIDLGVAVPLPEPTTALLLGAGCAALAWGRSARRRSA